MKEMCKIVPEGACPKCGNLSFIVVESSMGFYLTNRYGEITDYKEDHNYFKGKCTTCGAVWDMIPNGPTESGCDFMILTPLRRLYYEYTTPKTVMMNNIQNAVIENPMGIQNNK